MDNLAFLGSNDPDGPTDLIATLEDGKVMLHGRPGTPWEDYARGVMTKIAAGTPPYDKMSAEDVFNAANYGTFGPYGDVTPLDDAAQQKIDSTLLDFAKGVRNPSWADRPDTSTTSNLHNPSE
jgi:hypothetical protein